MTEGGETAIIKAINFGKANVVNELLELGANVNIKTYVSLSFHLCYNTIAIEQWNCINFGGEEFE